MGSNEVYLLPQRNAVRLARISPVADPPSSIPNSRPSGPPKTLSWYTWAQARLDSGENQEIGSDRQVQALPSRLWWELAVLVCGDADISCDGPSLLQRTHAVPLTVITSMCLGIAFAAVQGHVPSLI